jgi:hypothetical protein
MYSFANYLKEAVDSSGNKKFKWYAFGRTPLEIADHVASICSQPNTYSVDETDLRRMDGTISELAREICIILMKRVFHPRYHVELERLMRTQFNCYAVFKRDSDGFRVTFETDFSRGSGSPETSLLNTLIKVLCSYLANRFFYSVRTVEAHRKSWENIGIHAGDDGLQKHLPFECHERAAKALGLDIEVTRKTRLKDGLHTIPDRVSFLSRIYGPEVWTGDNNNCCDIVRILSKFHASPRSSSVYRPEEKVVLKAMGLILTDSQTPVVGDIMIAILASADCSGMKVGDVTVESFRHDLDYRSLVEHIPTGLVSWWVNNPVPQQWPNRYESWMDDYVEACGINCDVVRTWTDLCFSMSLKELLECIPLIVEPAAPPQPKASVVIKGEILVGSDPIQDLAIAKIAEEAKSKAFHNKGKKPPKRVPKSAEKQPATSLQQTKGQARQQKGKQKQKQKQPFVPTNKVSSQKKEVNK